MLEIPKQQAIYLAVKPVDMRKSFDGLSAIVHDVLKLNNGVIQCAVVTDTQPT
jgi:transposase